ncbi:MAG TPA: LLM class flavin-dependent oxidoreductase [Acidimicrobiales bacterium]|nr:LLM class flavin-dependent oxidoreductase [Acidimicrobiales bacterium]
MVMSIARFNMVSPGIAPDRVSETYKAALDMAEYMDRHGFAMATIDEHHGAPDGWMPSTLATAGMLLARTRTMNVALYALLLPLHDPLRVAEDMAVLDLASGGRLSPVVLGLGYRPEEYAMFAKDWANRGRLFDECVDALLKAWTGEPFEFRGTTVRVTPTPLTKPHPVVGIGGTSKAAARRAARFGLPFLPARTLPGLADYYYAQCAERGVEGFCMEPGDVTVMLHVAEDPDKAWAEVGRHFLHEATTYAAWQTPDIHSSVHSHATTVEALRAEGIYQVLTPAEVIARAKELGELAAFNLHPLCGGMPVDQAWESVQLYVDKVLPNV